MKLVESIAGFIQVSAVVVPGPTGPGLTQMSTTITGRRTKMGRSQLGGANPGNNPVQTENMNVTMV
eukprot:CAMPEP_0203790150 /NCGR_PEP_ID=MMETSP0100_2-20121128/3883_1 /ASSEMBLY_ACC=CAM_ASM_000210 /TAXON_ID=96639 /ORGANISM=" , Strain NY0313808BC1" /LENGTH=65 /DNA_ID=CAMNT_0050693253 /DNA_START=226 /DNA_END=420 /DNA_ORIENTATION=-